MDSGGAGVILERWRRARAEIDTAIEAALSELPEAGVVEAARYIARGGKRLRGFLLLEIAEALGGDRSKAIDAAVAVELVHAASLALDDIIDEDLTRRGFEAAWVKLGVKKTVMVSNLLIPYAQEIVARNYGPRALERTVAAWLDISRGEVIDAFMPPEMLDKNAYLEMVRLKTGALFRLSAELGVLAAGRDDILGEAARLGEVIGMVYQVADDIRDSRDPVRVEREPSLRLFLRWASPLEKAYEFIERTLDEVKKMIASMLDGVDTVLRELPEFIVSAMLGQGWRRRVG